MTLIAKNGRLGTFANAQIMMYDSLQQIFALILLLLAVRCGVRDRALASHTDVRGFEPQCGGRLSSLTC